MTSQPMLWRVPAYCEPGFPRPTTTFNDPPRTARCGPKPIRGDAERRRGVDGEGRARMVQGAPDDAGRRRAVTGQADVPSSRRSRAPHRRLLVGSARSQPQTWRAPWVTSSRSSSAGRPAHVAGVPATARLRLLDRPLDRDDDVAEVRTTARRGAAKRARGRAGRPAPGWAGTRRGTAAGTTGRRSGRPGPCASRSGRRARRRRTGSARSRPELGRRPRRAAATTPGQRRRSGDRTPSRTSRSIRQAVDRCARVTSRRVASGGAAG